MHRITHSLVIVLLGLCVMAAPGCERPKAPIDGLGGFSLAKSTVEGVQRQGAAQCFDSDGRTSCLIMARQSIAERSPQIQLEFASTEPDAVLRRILMEIPGCVLDEVRDWFVDRIGKPDTADDNGALWRQKHIVLSLRVVGPSRCQVIAVDPVDEPNVKLLLDAHASTSQAK